MVQGRSLVIFFAIVLCFLIGSASSSDGFKIISDTAVYSRWRTVLQRIVEFPDGQVVDYDVIDQKGNGAVTIFAWDSKTKTATLVRKVFYFTI